MSKPLHNKHYTHDVRNLCRMFNFDIRDLSPARPWLPDSDDYLIELYQQGKNIYEMAETMGRADWTIVGRIWELGNRGRITPEMWASKAKKPVDKLGPLDIRKEEARHLVCS